ncbi:MAG TPA: hypothetical protein VE133_07795 [Candidatus Sulfotelmatobacter sp.]|nr:hypothetical protein [Candidatus Sulfotelmatobacter sp.]
MAEEKFRTLMVIPSTGVYRVIHAAHRLPHKSSHRRRHISTLCDHEVIFELVRAARAGYEYQAVHVYEPPGN